MVAVRRRGEPEGTKVSEIRGEFSPISTSVNGILISEHLPRQASVMDKLAIVRSVSTSTAENGSSSTISGP